MAENKVVIKTEIQSNTAQEIKQVKELKGAYDSAAMSAAKVGGTAGSRRAAAQARPTGMTEAEYNAGRGTAGLTGASARDFANQAQGLGGLVRLYATYAANVFAVSAAFRALSGAMDTTNMIQGLNQLGASSGLALGNLAKQFANVSDGAISLREAMEATAKATSSGLSSTQLLKIGEVAKKASQALGVNMSDAVSRLTRGITKLEPELLDELGIFTKVGKATEDYARSIGKSVTSLTDLERRQAFANAVLEEGISKFSEINIPTNPYDKLLATLKNVSQSVLEVVNKALVPLVNLLSSSPNALLGILALIGAKIVQQALPAITSYREGLKASAVEAAEVASQKANAAKKALDIVRDSNAKELLARKAALEDIRVQEIDAAEQRLKAVSKKGLSKKTQEILSPTRDIQSITKAELTYLDTLGGKTTKASSAYRELAASIRAAQAANTDYARSLQAAEAQRVAAPGILSPAGIAAARAESARRVAASRGIVSNVGEVASEAGTLAAFSKLSSSLSTEKLGAVRTAFTGIAGAVTILGTALGGLLTVASKFLGWIGVIVGAYQVLEMVLGKNSEQVGAFNDSLTVLTDTTKNATDTAKRYQDVISVSALLAKTTALLELSGAIEKTSQAFTKATASAGMWDNFTNSIMGLFGKSLEDKFRTQITAAISAGLTDIVNPEIRAKAEAELLTLVGASSIEGISSSIKGMSTEELESLAKKLPGVFNAISKAADKAVEPIKSVKEGFSALDKSFQDLSNSLINKDPLSDFAVKLSQQATTLATAMQDPTNAAAVLADILKDTSQIKMFPPETQRSIIEAASQMQALTAEAARAKEQIELANAKLRAAGEMESSGIPREIVVRFKLEAEAALAAATETYKTATTKVAQLTTNLSSGLSKTVQESFRLIELPLSRAIAQANIETQKTLLNLLPKTPESVRLQTNLEIQSIELRKQEISTTRNLIAAIELDRISREKAALETKISTADANKVSPADKAAMELELKGLVQQEQAFKNPKALRQSGEIISTGAQNILRQNVGFLTQLEQLTQQQRSARIAGAVGEVSAGFDIERRNLQEQQKAQEASLSFFKSTDAFRSMDLAAQQRGLAGYDQELAAIRQELELLEYRKDLAVAATALVQAQAVGAKDIVSLAEKEVSVSTERLNKAQANSDAVNSAVRAEKSRTNELALQNEQLALANIKLEEQKQLRDVQDSTEQKLADVRKQELDWLLQTRAISESFYQEQVKELDRTNLAKQKTIELYQAEAKFLVEINGLVKDYLAQTSDTGRAQVAARMQSTTAIYEAQVKGINTVYSAQESLMAQQQSFTDRQKAFGDAFERSFEGLTDVIIEFAKTGKLNFKGMVDSFVQDLLRYELKQMQMSLVSKFGGVTGITSSFMNVLGFSNPIGAANAPGGANFGMDLGFEAKGGVYDAGVRMFAKGGAFTNSVVDSPTLFKFASGAGMMGEAGPEAIMPLKRGPDGSLGVQVQDAKPAEQQPINIVNNFTISGNVDRATQQQIAAAASRAMQRATVRNS